MRKEVPLALGFVMGASIVMAMFFRQITALTAWKVILDDWFQIVTAWAVGVGVVNLAQIHGRNVSARRPGWIKSAWLVLCMFGMMFFGFFIAKDRSAASWQWAYTNLISPMNSTVYSTFGLFTASAAYRTFRFRNLESAVFVICALSMMIGRVPIGRMIAGPWIATFADWLQNAPTAAAMRGLQLGAVLGGMVTALRMLLGIERGYLSSSGE